MRFWAIFTFSRGSYQLFTYMKQIFRDWPRWVIFLFLASILTVSCSRKSGCPAERAQVKTDKDGSYKPSKTKSGLLPPKAEKKRKKH